MLKLYLVTIDELSIFGILWNMTTQFLLAQVFGLLAFIISICSIIQKNRVSYIYYNLSQNVCSGVQYFLIDKMVAFYLCIVTILRLIIYRFKDKYNKVLYVFILIFFVLLSVIVSIITFANWYDIFPAIASVLVCFSVWQDSVVIIKIVFIITKVLWGIYACFTLAYFAIAMDILMIVWTIINLCKTQKIKNDKY